VLRGVLLKGIGVEMLWRELAALAVIAFVLLSLASMRLKRQWA
jgi:hypothetical protein